MIVVMVCSGDGGGGYSMQHTISLVHDCTTKNRPFSGTPLDLLEFYTKPFSPESQPSGFHRNPSPSMSLHPAKYPLALRIGWKLSLGMLGCLVLVVR